MTEQATDDATIDEMKALNAEVDAAVDEIVKTSDTDGTNDRDEQNDDSAGGEVDESKDDEKSLDDSAKDDGDEKDDSDDDGDEDAVTDEHLERAVKAGFTMAEARKFGSGSLLDATVSRLEAGKGGDSGTGGDSENDGSEGDDPLAAIPDLDPNEYDEKIVAGFKAMKDIIRSQHSTIQGLQSSPPASADWFEKQASGMGKAVSAAITSDPTKLDAIRDKFSVLEAGYKAAGKTVDREAIFQEAASIAMGDVVAQAAVDEKADKLDKRSRQHINRPAGHRGASPKGDPLEEVAAEIDAKFFAKT